MKTIRTTIALFLIAYVLTGNVTTPTTPAAPPATNAAPATTVPPAGNAPAADGKAAEKSKFALLNMEKDNLNDDDLSNIFQQDLTALSGDSKIDEQCGSKLDLALRGAAADPNALAFIFSQATEGRLCAMLGQTQADIDAAMKNFKDAEGFTPVANNKAAQANQVDQSLQINMNPGKNAAGNNAAPAANAGNNGAPAANAGNNAAPAANAGNNAAANNKTTNTGNAVNTGNNVDPAVVAAQKAKQDEQMKAAQAAINNLFSQVGNKMNVNSAMPSINFGGPSAGGNSAPKADLGAGLARVAVPSSSN